MGKHYTIKEYEGFIQGETIPGKFVGLPEHTFIQLEKFVLSNRSASVSETDALDLMSISSRRDVGKIISAKNYVGLISMKDGTEIEILPKIYSAQDVNKDATKRVFLEMLKTVKEIPYKKFTVSHLKAERMNIFEVFIRMYIDEVYTLVKRGLKANYTKHSDNEAFYKGKMLFSQHVRENYAHKERFCIEYDIFSTNRPENRLIKSTLYCLFGQTKSARNSKDISMLISSFDGIDYSHNFENDFSQYTQNRNMSEYETLMRWCRVFLFNKSFTAFSGCEVAFALLFPMEQIFESYVAACIKKRLDKVNFSIKTQDKQYHLFDQPSKRFSIRPDIVVTGKSNDSITIMDTKWKVLSASWYNYGISQTDMYQMYAYHKKYKAKQVILLYPMTESVKTIPDGIIYQSEEGITIRVMFVDLMNMNDSVNRILAAQ